MSDTAGSIPKIYAPTFAPRALPFKVRCLWGGLACICGLVLVTAYRLTPSPDGLGTHTSLGLSRCPFLYYSGIPCPSCGMTTSFAHFAHGNLLASAWVQPMGLVLALLAAATFWVGLYVAMTGHDFLRLLGRLPMQWIIPGLALFGIAAWGWKIWIHLHGIDGWG